MLHSSNLQLSWWTSCIPKVHIIYGLCEFKFFIERTCLGVFFLFLSAVTSICYETKLFSAIKKATQLEAWK